MASDVIDYVTISVYGNYFTGVIDEDTIKVTLTDGIVKYKSNVYLRSFKEEYTPDATTGKVTMTLPDTDNMDGKVYYIFDFGNGVKYRSKVPYSATEVDFWDLPLERNRTKEFLDLG